MINPHPPQRYPGLAVTTPVVRLPSGVDETPAVVVRIGGGHAARLARQHGITRLVPAEATASRQPAGRAPWPV